MSILDTQKDIYDFLKQFAQPYFETDHQSLDLNPNNLAYPLITYSFNLENWREIGLAQLRIWDKQDDYTTVFNIADTIEKTIKEGYKYNNLIIHQGSPFLQVIPQQDENIKCLYINLEINYVGGI